MKFDPIMMFEKFGLPIAFLVVMIRLFVKANDNFNSERGEHRKERAEWREAQQHLQKDTNAALRDLTKVISEKKT